LLAKDLYCLAGSTNFIFFGSDGFGGLDGQKALLNSAAAASPKDHVRSPKRKKPKWQRKRNDSHDIRHLGTIYTQMSKEIGATDPSNPLDPSDPRKQIPGTSRSKT
jgi:hypothetical protein